MRPRFQVCSTYQRIAGQPFVLVLLLFATSGWTMAHAGSQFRKGDVTLINKFIASHESRENGIENAANLRTTMAGDLNHDGVPDVAVLYTLEGQNGTNHYVQHLAAFLRLKKQLVPIADEIVGGKTYRSAQIASIKNNVIFLKSLQRATRGVAPALRGRPIRAGGQQAQGAARQMNTQSVQQGVVCQVND